MNVVNMLATALHMTPFARGLGGGGEGGEGEFLPGLSSVLNHYNSVCPVYISKVTGVNPPKRANRLAPYTEPESLLPGSGFGLWSMVFTITWASGS